MEYLVLDGEVPPNSPKEWSHSPAEITLGPTTRIPLSDVSLNKFYHIQHNNSSHKY